MSFYNFLFLILTLFRTTEILKDEYKEFSCILQPYSTNISVLATVHALSF